MSILKALNNAYDLKEKRNWDKLFFFFDLHGTVIKPNYKYGDIPSEFYPHALETLQFLTKIDDVCMIIFTCSHPHEIELYIKIFNSNSVTFDHINENPEVLTQSGGYGCYDKKPYMNVLFEDKAGFDGNEDWLPVLNFLKEKYPNAKHR
jgi:hypothetical protein